MEMEMRILSGNHAVHPVDELAIKSSASHPNI
jgi:hypothetical protein